MTMMPGTTYAFGGTIFAPTARQISEAPPIPDAANILAAVRYSIQASRAYGFDNPLYFVPYEAELLLRGDVTHGGLRRNIDYSRQTSRLVDSQSFQSRLEREDRAAEIERRRRENPRVWNRYVNQIAEAKTDAEAREIIERLKMEANSYGLDKEQVEAIVQGVVDYGSQQRSQDELVPQAILEYGSPRTKHWGMNINQRVENELEIREAARVLEEGGSYELSDDQDEGFQAMLAGMLYTRGQLRESDIEKLKDPQLRIRYRNQIQRDIASESQETYRNVMFDFEGRLASVTNIDRIREVMDEIEEEHSQKSYLSEENFKRVVGRMRSQGNRQIQFIERNIESALNDHDRQMGIAQTQLVRAMDYAARDFGQNVAIRTIQSIDPDTNEADMLGAVKTSREEVSQEIMEQTGIADTFRGIENRRRQLEEAGATEEQMVQFQQRIAGFQTGVAIGMRNHGFVFPESLKDEYPALTSMTEGLAGREDAPSESETMARIIVRAMIDGIRADFGSSTRTPLETFQRANLLLAAAQSAAREAGVEEEVTEGLVRQRDRALNEAIGDRSLRTINKSIEDLQILSSEGDESVFPPTTNRSDYMSYIRSAAEVGVAQAQENGNTEASLAGVMIGWASTKGFVHDDFMDVVVSHYTNSGMDYRNISTPKDGNDIIEEDDFTEVDKFFTSVLHAAQGRGDSTNWNSQNERMLASLAALATSPAASQDTISNRRRMNEHIHNILTTGARISFMGANGERLPINYADHFRSTSRNEIPGLVATVAVATPDGESVSVKIPKAALRSTTDEDRAKEFESMARLELVTSSAYRDQARRDYIDTVSFYGDRGREISGMVQRRYQLMSSIINGNLDPGYTDKGAAREIMGARLSSDEWDIFRSMIRNYEAINPEMAFIGEIFRNAERYAGGRYMVDVRDVYFNESTIREMYSVAQNAEHMRKMGIEIVASRDASFNMREFLDRFDMRITGSGTIKFIDRHGDAQWEE